MNFCPECGNKLNDTDKFCTNCGYAVHVRKEAIMTETSSDGKSPNVVEEQVATPTTGRLKLNYQAADPSKNPNVLITIDNDLVGDITAGDEFIKDLPLGKYTISLSGGRVKPVRIVITLTEEKPKASVNFKYNPGKPGAVEFVGSNTQVKSTGTASQLSGTAMNNKPVKKKRFLIPAIIAVLVIIFLIPKQGSSSSKNTPKTTPTPKPTPTATPTASAPVPTPDASITRKANASDVFYINLLQNPRDYLNSYVVTTFPISNIYSTGKIYSKRISGKELMVETGKESIYDNKDDYKYSTIRGLVSKVDSYQVVITNADIDYIGANEPTVYTEQLSAYTEQVHQGKLVARKQFIESAQKVSYSELARYPDTYMKQPLEMSVYIKEVEPDGLISNGNVLATYGGGEIAIYDYREVREPRLKAGDSLTIYAQGDGLTKMKTYVKGSGFFGTNLGADVVDEYEIPAVQMIYTNLDRLASFGLSSSNDDDYYYNLGKQAADKLNSLIGAD